MPPPAAARTAGAGTSSDRRQSTRQGRTTVRPTNYYARTFAGRLAANGMEQTPEATSGGGDFCPALTHFTQAVDAFPKELIRHFSMFKEVEAKIHDPEHMLRLLLDEVAQMPVPTKAQRRHVTQNGNAADNSVAATVNGSATHDPTAHLSSFAPDEQADMQRRQVFFRLRMLIVNLLPTLDEKLVVLGGAIASKDRGLARMNNSYSHLDSEISEEARYGSLTHWAYADKEEKKKGGASHERQRREVVSANNLAAAAQHVHDVDSIAAKSEARREAMLANKRNRHHHNDSDFDDRPVKKPQKRKAVATDSTGDSRNIGLGITSNGAPPQGKRKKTEKALAAAAAAPPMERSLSGALKPAGGGRGGTSPRATPGVEAGPAGKRKPRAVPTQTQRKYPLPHNSPPPSSPLTGNFTLPKATVPATDRPVPSRARNNSIAHSVTSNTAEPSIARRPSSSHSVQQVPNSNVITELEQTGSLSHENASKEPSPPKDSAELPPLEILTTTTTLKHEEIDTQEPVRMEIDIPVPAPVTTRAGRTSKTATPIVGTFAEVPMSRSRSTRKANNGNGNSNASSENNSTVTGTVSKRLPKKAAQAGGTMLQSPALPAVDPKSNPHSSRASSIAPEQDSQDADSEEDGDEPRYCYCNQVSYGNMIACDNESCAREWFHLPCVNLDRAPSGRKKWFCSDECKDAYAEGKTARSGRPGSSRQ